MSKPFDVLVDGLISKDIRGDKTAIELFVVNVQGWEAGLRRILRHVGGCEMTERQG
jgi:hypothetical protein